MTKEDEFDLSEVQTVLETQYDATVAFCNAQTSLLNATTPSSRKQEGDGALHDALDEYSTCLRRVQRHWERLQQMEQTLQTMSECRRLWAVYKSHVERTERVLQTVQHAGGGGVWSSHGVPLAGVNDSNTVTVALATLRASIDAVREVLLLYLKE